MLARFSLYGFLKNQRYYEPFLVLLLLDRGVSFTALGLLIGLRKLTRAASEIPSQRRIINQHAHLSIDIRRTRVEVKRTNEDLLPVHQIGLCV